MTVDLLERPSSSEALSDSEWATLTLGETRRPRFQPFTDITSTARYVSIPFGQVALVFSEAPPPWCDGLLARISELGDLQENWDSYGARSVDPHCAVATVRLLLSLCDPHKPKPAIVPTSRGGIQLEWHRAGADLEIEIESPAKFHVFFEDEQTGDETEVTLTDDLLPLVPLLERLSAAE